MSLARTESGPNPRDERHALDMILGQTSDLSLYGEYEMRERLEYIRSIARYALEQARKEGTR